MGKSAITEPDEGTTGQMPSAGLIASATASRAAFGNAPSTSKTAPKNEAGSARPAAVASSLRTAGSVHSPAR